MWTSRDKRHNSHRVTQHSPAILKQKCHQIKPAGQTRQNFCLQCKHTAVPGLSQAFPRKSTQSTKNLITDHDNKQAAKKPLEAAQKYTRRNYSKLLSLHPKLGFSTQTSALLTDFTQKPQPLFKIELQTIDNNTNWTSYQCLIWKTRLKSFWTFSKFISWNI